MQYKTHQSFASLLTKAADLRKITAKLEQLEQISQVIASKLDTSLVNNCKVSNLRDGTLILSTNSPAWNHKLRFSSLDLLSTLRSDPRWSGLKSIEVLVDYLPQLEGSQSTIITKTRPMSQASAVVITEAADNISCKPLAEVLKRIAKRSTPPSKDVDKL